MSDLTNTYYLNAIAMEYEGDHEKVAEAVRRSMAFHHDFDPKDKRAIFVFDVFADLLDLRVITTGIKILLGFIGLLTLGIGGVGLMNIMLVSVTQRTREIGVEKALGARGWHILVQFLAEALAITLLGGLAGVVLAYIVSWSVGSMTLWSAFIENGTEEMCIRDRVHPVQRDRWRYRDSHRPEGGRQRLPHPRLGALAQTDSARNLSFSGYRDDYGIWWLSLIHI